MSEADATFTRMRDRIAEMEAERDRMLGIKPEELAQKFHAAYEGLAESMNYQTRRASAVPWERVPTQNKALMVATCAEVLADLRSRIRGKKP